MIDTAANVRRYANEESNDLMEEAIDLLHRYADLLDLLGPLAATFQGRRRSVWVVARGSEILHVAPGPTGCWTYCREHGLWDLDPNNDDDPKLLPGYTITHTIAEVEEA